MKDTMLKWVIFGSVAVCVSITCVQLLWSLFPQRWTGSNGFFNAVILDKEFYLARHSGSSDLNKSTVENANYSKNDVFHIDREYFPNYHEQVALSTLCNTDFNVPDRNLHRRREGQHIVELPNFAVDYSEYLLGAILERTSDSYSLHLTAFFLCHYLTEPRRPSSVKADETILYLHPNPAVVSNWMKLARTFRTHNIENAYYGNGERKQPPYFYCRITHNALDVQEELYTVRGHFIPNRLTTDANANKRLDVLRCPMRSSAAVYRQYARSNRSLTVEILRGNMSIISFQMPWKSRMTGYLLQHPPEAKASVIDMWKGYNSEHPLVEGEKWPHDVLFMCMPGLEILPNLRSLSYLVEWIQHHLNIGVSHIFITVTLTWTSIHMARLLWILQSYIQEGLVSVTSASGDDIDGVYSIDGAVWSRDNIKNFYVNMCTYLSKGVSDYVGVWDFDEFFIPRGHFRTIPDIIHSEDRKIQRSYLDALGTTIDSIHTNWKKLPGLADGDGHELCFLYINTEVIGNADQLSESAKNLWLGQRFSHPSSAYGSRRGRPVNASLFEYVKSIRPTRSTFLAGLHVVGACHLSTAWNGCTINSTEDIKVDDFCRRLQNDVAHKVLINTTVHFDTAHRSNEPTHQTDARRMNGSIATMYHFMLNRNWFKSLFTYGNNTELNDYSKYYFRKTLDELKTRNLVQILTRIDQNISDTHFIPPFPSVPKIKSVVRKLAGCWMSYQRLHSLSVGLQELKE